MNEKYAGKDLPRRHNSQSDAHVRKHPDFEVGCNTKLPELWKNVETSHFGILEEGDMEIWAYGRFVCVGDSVHKSTINVNVIFSSKNCKLTLKSVRTRGKHGYRECSYPFK